MEPEGVQIMALTYLIDEAAEGQPRIFRSVLSTPIEIPTNINLFNWCIRRHSQRAKLVEEACIRYT